MSEGEIEESSDTNPDHEYGHWSWPVASSSRSLSSVQFPDAKRRRLLPASVEVNYPGESVASFDHVAEGSHTHTNTHTHRETWTPLVTRGAFRCQK